MADVLRLILALLAGALGAELRDRLSSRAAAAKAEPVTREPMADSGGAFEPVPPLPGPVIRDAVPTGEAAAATSAAVRGQRPRPRTKHSARYLGALGVLIVGVFIAVAVLGSAGSRTAPRSSATAPGPSWGDGDLKVGKDIQPGTYKALVSDSSAYWARTTDLSGSFDSILANANVEGRGVQVVVTVQAGDFALTSTGFAKWVPVDGPSLLGGRLGSGTLIVGKDIQPGVYRASVVKAEGTWSLVTGPADLAKRQPGLAENQVDHNGEASVTINATDYAFSSTGFGDWVKVG